MTYEENLSLKEMTDPAVASVEPLCVEPVETVHAFRKAFPLGREDEVVVVRHQAVRVDVPGELADDLPELCPQRDVVVCVANDRSPRNSA
jgi:hypothetical protein